MTWLPVAIDGPSERDCVLGLQPEAYACYRELLEATAAATDTDLLELCKARIAQMLECREELARHSPERLAELESWERSPSLTDTQRAALRFTEQFVLDPSLVDRALVAELEIELSTEGEVSYAGDSELTFATAGVVNFATAIAAHEASMRLAKVLDFAPERDLP